MGDSLSSISRSLRLRYRMLRALGFLTFTIPGFRSAPPQALCCHPLRGLKSICHGANLEFIAKIAQRDCGARAELDFDLLAWD